MGPREKLFPPFYDFVKSAISGAGNLYLKNRNLPLAREMFRLGMYGGGKGMSPQATKLIIEAMKNSEELQNKILALTESGKDFDTGKFDFGFEKR